MGEAAHTTEAGSTSKPSRNHATRVGSLGGRKKEVVERNVLFTRKQGLPNQGSNIE